MGRGKKREVPLETPYYRDGRDIRYSEEAYKRFRAYQSEWIKQNHTSLHVHFRTVDDADVIEWLNNRKNKTDYLRSLIRADIALCQKEGITPEDREEGDS